VIFYALFVESTLCFINQFSTHFSLTFSFAFMLLMLHFLADDPFHVTANLCMFIIKKFFYLSTFVLTQMYDKIYGFTYECDSLKIRQKERTKKIFNSLTSERINMSSRACNIQILIFYLIIGEIEATIISGM
jgi:hypothetical protein